jgi:hypothetical protein
VVEHVDEPGSLDVVVDLAALFKLRAAVQEALQPGQGAALVEGQGLSHLPHLPVRP